ncbi:chaperone modulator CbpM [Emcibacter sp. SYSU 3D8]|uniref:chaperone modulator CbpM n=1 Tax=Emcibacter sp. SYSU 3D8 TaxID=3133969 RepID=UPI0031FF3A7A
MRLSEQDVVAAVAGISTRRLRMLVRNGWIRPERMEGAPAFSEVDVARVRLVCHLTDQLEIQEDDMPVILSLVDQVYGLRRALRNLSRAVESQPDEVRTEIVRAFRDLDRLA